jgi:hypothetical protein
VIQAAVPATSPNGDGQEHGDPGLAGDGSQHQKSDVTQIVPGECWGSTTCAEAAVAKADARMVAKITRLIDRFSAFMFSSSISPKSLDTREK